MILSSHQPMPASPTQPFLWWRNWWGCGGGGVGEEDRDQHKEREIEGVRGRRGASREGV